MDTMQVPHSMLLRALGAMPRHKPQNPSCWMSFPAASEGGWSDQYATNATQSQWSSTTTGTRQLRNPPHLAVAKQ